MTHEEEIEEAFKNYVNHSLDPFTVFDYNPAFAFFKAGWNLRQKKMEEDWYGQE